MVSTKKFYSKARAKVADQQAPSKSSEDVRHIAVRVLDKTPDNKQPATKVAPPSVKAQAPKPVKRQPSRNEASKRLTAAPVPSLKVPAAKVTKTVTMHQPVSARRRNTSSYSRKFSDVAGYRPSTIDELRMTQGTPTHNYETPIMQQYHRGSTSGSTSGYVMGRKLGSTASLCAMAPTPTPSEVMYPTESSMRPIFEDPSLRYGPDLYRKMKDGLRAYRPKFNMNQSQRISPSSNGDTSVFLPSELDPLSRIDESMAVSVNILDGKTVRVRTSQDNTDGLYLTGYQYNAHINPKYRFAEKTDEGEQMFIVEHYQDNRCVLLSSVKYHGYIKPALFFSASTNELQLRDLYPYDPKGRKYFRQSSNTLQYFMFDCNDYKIVLPGFGELELEVVQQQMAN